MLFPKAEVNTILGVALLPTVFGILSQAALGQILDDIVLVKDLLISLGTPVCVPAEGLGVTQRHSLLSEIEIGEVVS